AETPEDMFAILARTLNANLGPRVFVPAIGVICGHGPFGVPYDDPNRTSELSDVRPWIEERDRCAAERELLAQERDRCAAERELLAQERDRRAEERDRYAGERDRLMQERDRLTGDLDRVIGHRDRALGERDDLREQFEALHSSRSWRWTRSLRTLKGMLFRPERLVKANRPS